MSDWSNAWSTLVSFFPPDLSLSYLWALKGPVLESLGMTVGAMVLAYVLSLPIGLYLGMRGPGSRPILWLLTSLRAIPDLTLAIFCVIAFGIGPGAGLLALAIFYAAALGKVLADLFQTAARGPMAALRATGASRTQVALYGLLPLKLSDVITYGSYEFECAVRSSVIVGAVGGGGLGAELVGSLNAFDFQRSATIVLILVLMVALIDFAAFHFRRRPRWVAILIPFGAYALYALWPHSITLVHAAHTIAGMFPPTLPAKAWATLPTLLLETVEMAVFGTLLAVVLAIPLGMLAARNLTPFWLAIPVRRALEVLRAIPEVVWGLILVAIAGIGPIAGIWALGLHSAGCLGRLFAESFENVPVAPVNAIASTGASRLSIATYATFPLAIGPLAIHGLFRLEWNMRQATVVGMIGAGGIGQALYEAQQLFFYPRMMAYLIITWLVVLLVDALSQHTRRRLDGAHLAIEERVH